MFIDTFQVSDTFLKMPDEKRMQAGGWDCKRHPYTGEVNTFYLNPKKGEPAPSLTIKESYGGRWILYAQISPSAWLQGSNIHLVEESEFQRSLKLLSEYASDMSGYRFDALEARVSRVDFTRNFQLGESAVKPLISNYLHFKLPKYFPRLYENGIYFEGSGKTKNKTYKLYSKYDEVLVKKGSTEEIEAAKGILRLEIQYRKAAVNYLAKSLRLKGNKAKLILTPTTAMQAIDLAMGKLRFAEMFKSQSSDHLSLLKEFGTTTLIIALGTHQLQSSIGDLSKIPDVNISQKTIKRYQEKCRQIGLLS